MITQEATLLQQGHSVAEALHNPSLDDLPKDQSVWPGVQKSECFAPFENKLLMLSSYIIDSRRLNNLGTQNVFPLWVFHVGSIVA